MPPTRVANSQLQAVDPALVSAAETRFKSFLGLSLVLLILVAVSMGLEAYIPFWEGNRIWAIGSLFVCISVLHARHFDIKRIVAPHNEKIDESQLSKTCKYLESLAKHAWIIGFILVAVSRWKRF